MAANLMGPARREKATAAYLFALRRVTYGEIARRLGISRQLVTNLVHEEQQRQWAERDDGELDAERRRAIDTYEAVIRSAWERLARIGDNSLNVSGIFNAIIGAQKAIDAITGVKTQAKTENGHTREHDLIDLSEASEEFLAELERLTSEGVGPEEER